MYCPSAVRRFWRVTAFCIRDGRHWHPHQPAIIVGAHRTLGAGASRVVVASLDDLQAVHDRPNLPGTTLPSNWTTALTAPIEELETSALSTAIVDGLRQTR